MSRIIPVIDLFAGPGGLSEGFGRYADWAGANTRFGSVLSIEKSEPAARTLRLRTFFRKFAKREVPEEYWSVLRGAHGVEVLENFSEWKAAGEDIWNAELGKIPLEELHGRISRRLAESQNWVLLGGPPCQAYSLVGRARMTGIGFDARSNPDTSERVRQERLSKFDEDVRHTLYREYLRIIAVHQPTVFVMENVKGILSAKVPGDNGLMFDRIRTDLQNPWKALADDEDLETLTRLARAGRPHYRLFAFVDNGSDLWSAEPHNRDFLIKAEEFGIPQKRHRVVVLGVREGGTERTSKLTPAKKCTVRDAIGHLPRVRSGVSKTDSLMEWIRQRRSPFEEGAALQSTPIARTICEALDADVSRLNRGSAFVPYSTAAPETLLEKWLEAPQLGGFSQHESRGHMGSDLGRYLFAASVARVLGRSPKLQEWPRELLPAHRNVSFSARTGEIETGGFDDRFKVQVWEEPASTVTSHIAKDGHYFIHPDPVQTRSLTVREAARLQTFPDDYYFCGNRTEAYAQIGNAVPPFLGVQLAAVVAQLFESFVSNEVSGSCVLSPELAHND
jgi:DNA (cytosine-5)-methyltransferase 1